MLWSDNQRHSPHNITGRNVEIMDRSEVMPGTDDALATANMWLSCAPISPSTG